MAGEILESGVHITVIVVGAASCNFLRSEGYVEVIVEVAVVRRNPSEAPTHPLTDSFYLLNGSTGHSHISDIMVFQMHQNALNMVDREGTPNALPDLPRSHHEMFHEEPASTVEQLRKSHLALRRKTSRLLPTEVRAVLRSIDREVS